MPIIDISLLQSFTAINLLSDPGHIGGPVVIPQAAQITLNWSLTDGKTAHNVLYGSYTGGFAGTVAQADGIFTGLSTGASWTAMALHLAPGTSFTGVSIRNVNVANQALISSTGAAKPGTSTGTALPSEVAIVVTLRTALTGRANRGRIYIPGWATTALGANDVIAAAAVTALQNWANTIGSVFNTNGYTLSLGHPARGAYVSPKTGVSYPARPAGTVPISGLPVRNNTWDSQRRRGLK